MITEHYHKFISNNLQTTIQSFFDQGIKVGTGNYGVCLVPPDKDYVYKVWTIDPAFDAWIRYCKENKSKHLPTVYKIVTLPIEIPGSNHPEVTVAKIKKYKPMPSSFLKKLKWKTQEGKQITFQQCPIFRTMWREDTPSTIRSMLLSYESLNNITSEFTNTILDVLDVLENLPTKIKVDIHDQNIMMDGSNYIITDPVVSVNMPETTLSLSREVPNEPKSRLRKLTGEFIVDYDEYFKSANWSEDTPDSIYIQHLQKCRNSEKFFDVLPSAEVILKFLKINFPKIGNSHDGLSVLDAYNYYSRLGYGKQMANLFVDIMHSDVELLIINKYMLPFYKTNSPILNSRYGLYSLISDVLNK